MRQEYEPAARSHHFETWPISEREGRSTIRKVIGEDSPCAAAHCRSHCSFSPLGHPGSIAACPQNQLGPGGNGLVQLAARGQLEFPSNDQPRQLQRLRRHARHILRLLCWRRRESGECGSSGGVYVEDDFSILGLPAGTPVSITAHLTGSLSAAAGRVLLCVRERGRFRTRSAIHRARRLHHCRATTWRCRSRPSRGRPSGYISS